MPELCCGKCGYNVRGLPSSTCPECGSDLDVVGRVPADRQRGKAIRRAILFAALLAIGTGGLLFLVHYTLIPFQVDRSATVWLFGPQSGAFVDIRMDLHSSGWRLAWWPVEDASWQTCRIKLQRLDGSSKTIVADLGDRTFRVFGSGGRAAGPEHPTTPETLSDWLSRNNLDATADEYVIRAEGATIARVLEDAATCGPVFQWSRVSRAASTGTNFSWSKSASGPKILGLVPGSSFLSASFWRRGSVRWLDASKWLMVGLGMLIWISGLWYFIWRRRLVHARS
jgi:hypothetical protein